MNGALRSDDGLAEPQFAVPRSTIRPLGRQRIRHMKLSIKLSSPVILLALTAPCLSIAGCARGLDANQAKATATERSAVRIVPIRPERKTLKRVVELPGHVEAFEVAPLHAKVTGYVEAMCVDIGDRVSGPKESAPGTPLCRLLVPELEEELAQKTALVAQAKAEVQQAEAAVMVAEAVAQSSQAKILEAEAALIGENATFERWSSEFERIGQLASSGAVTKKVLDETRSQRDATSAGKQEAMARIASAKASARESAAGVQKSNADLAAMRSRLSVAEADERRVRALHSYSTIHAPFDGVVVERNVHTGHLVRSGGGSGERPLLTIMRTDPVRIVVDVPEADAIYLNSDSPVTIKIPSLPGESLQTAITRTSWSLNTTSRTLRAEVIVSTESQRLRPGLYVQVELTVSQVADVLTLPLSAVFTHEKQRCCYTVGPDNQIVLTPLVLGLQGTTEVEIRSGLGGRELVIGANPAAFRPGLKVDLAPPAPAI